MTKDELIGYIKKRDRYYQGWDISDYPHEILLSIKQYIDRVLDGLPKGYSISSNGKAEQPYKNENKKSKYISEIL